MWEIETKGVGNASARSPITPGLKSHVGSPPRGCRQNWAGPVTSPCCLRQDPPIAAAGSAGQRRTGDQGRHAPPRGRRQVARPVLQPSGRALFAGLSRLLDRGRWERFFVQPETLLRWHRDLVRRRAGLGPMSTGLVGPHHLMFRSIGWKAPRWSDTAKRCLSVGQVLVTHAWALLFGATDVQSALSSLIRDLDASRSDSRSGIHWCCHSPEDRRYVETDRSSPDQ